ncbi:hypothetical protein KIN20_010337 [Parelaphostrongylus tenuis]|uniref:Uncharacterized protein n=1 Tax=Parelaphostrongylus tenuis TaxID=148309 RepID=A0AAD5MTY3_PARTN|nr:hypothetical protein KIN20_010337 [Parelaphostrongylus tenuis]
MVRESVLTPIPTLFLDDDSRCSRDVMLRCMKLVDPFELYKPDLYQDSMRDMVTASYVRRFDYGVGWKRSAVIAQEDKISVRRECSQYNLPSNDWQINEDSTKDYELLVDGLGICAKHQYPIRKVRTASHYH